MRGRSQSQTVTHGGLIREDLIEMLVDMTDRSKGQRQTLKDKKIQSTLQSELSAAFFSTIDLVEPRKEKKTQNTNTQYSLLRQTRTHTARAARNGACQNPNYVRGVSGGRVGTH